jgi:UDP-N-acetylmuramate--alanine ligase
VAAFQPHRFTRTHELFDEFVTAFYDADVLVMTDVYSAGEQPIEGATADRLAEEISRHGQKDVSYIADREQIPSHLATIVKEGDIVITLGAGNIWQQGEALVKLLGGTI